MVGFSFARFAPFFIVTILLAGCSGSGGDGATAGSGGGGTGGTDGPRADVLKTGLFGSVQDASGRPLARAAVEVAGRRAATDENGEFVIATSTIGDAVIRFRADGYLPAVRRVTIADGSPTAAHAVVKQRAAAQRMTADTGGTVAGAREAAVTIEPGDLSGSDQTSVTGMVDVHVTPVDPSDGSEVQALTASFDDGIDLLESFGMVDVTIMQGANELDVADGETLTIRIPAPAGTPSDLLDDTMPLWSLDEETGRWVEEGTLTLDKATNTYVGEISHLSAWNADRRATATCIAGIAVDQDDDPVPGAAVDTKGVDYSGSSAANTGEDGRFYVAVRKSSRVSVSVVHAAGGGATRDVDSTEEDTTLPPTLGDARCLDVGEFTIEREVPVVPSCVPMACEDTGDECTVGECNAETGNCDVTNVTDGTECDDGVSRCSAGECIDLCEDAECPSEDECVQDGTCDPDSGDCIDGNDEPTDTACGDGWVCDGAGECVECNEASQCDDDPGNECDTASCESGQCGLVTVMDGTECDFMGSPGMCEGSVCVEVPPCTTAENCNDNDVCTVDACPDGMCMYSPASDGSPCQVEDVPGECTEGVCIGLCDGADCTSDTVCRDDGTCNEQNGECIPGNPAPIDTGCNENGGTVCDGAGNCVEGMTDLACGRLVSGSIDQAGETDFLTFAGQAGDVILLTTVRTSGFNNAGDEPITTIYSPTNAEVDEFRGTGHRLITLSETGTHTVRVRSLRLTLTGTYTVGLECLDPVDPENVVPIGLGDLLTDSIAAAGEVDLFTLTGDADDVILLTTVRTSGFNNAGDEPITTIYSPSSTVVDQYRGSSQRQITLPEAGTYVISVRSLRLNLTGEYAVGVEGLDPLSPDPVPLVLTDLSTGSIETAGEVDLFTLTGDADDVILLTTVRTSGFNNAGDEPITTIYSPSSTVVDQYRGSSQRQITLPEAGTYVISVRSLRLNLTGEYTVGVEGLDPLSVDAVSINPGDLLTGAIDAPGETDLFTFSAQAGAAVLLTTVRTSGFNSAGDEPITTMFSPTLVEVVSFRGSNQSQVTVPATGTYIVRLRSLRLTLTGTYNLGLEQL